MTIQEKLSHLSQSLGASSYWSYDHYWEYPVRGLDKICGRRVVILQDTETGMPRVEETEVSYNNELSWWDRFKSDIRSISSLYFTTWTSDVEKERNRQTIQFFRDVFGSKRIEHVSKRYRLDLQTKYEQGLSISMEDVRQMFLGIGDVRCVDITELMEEARNLKSRMDEARAESPSLWYLNDEEKKSLCLRNFSFHETEQFFDAVGDQLYDHVLELDKRAMDAAMRILIPFRSVDEVFLGHKLNVSRIGGCGDSEYGLRNRVCLLNHLKVTDAPSEIAELVWQYKVAKKLVNRNLPAGTIIPHPYGYYVSVNSPLTNEGKGGAFIAFLRGLGKTSRLTSAVFCLGTQFHDNDLGGIYSKVGNFEKEGIGASGSKATLPGIREMIENPEKGFCRGDPDEKFDLVGFSQGGARAQFVMTQLPEKFEKMTAVCGAGVDKGTIDHFRQISDHFTHPVTINYVQELKDIVPCSGDGKIGHGCNENKVKVNCFTIVDGEVNPQEVREYIHPEHMDLKIAMGRIWQAFIGPYHCHDSFTDLHSIIAINNRDHTQLLNDFLLPDQKHLNRIYEALRQFNFRSQDPITIQNEVGDSERIGVVTLEPK